MKDWIKIDRTGATPSFILSFSKDDFIEHGLSHDWFIEYPIEMRKEKLMQMYSIAEIEANPVEEIKVKIIAKSNQKSKK